MNRSDPARILADLEALISDTRDCLRSEGDRIALVHLANARECLRQVVERETSYTDNERPSYPPGLFEENQHTRKTATEHFRKAREHTSEAVRRLRRGQ